MRGWWLGCGLTLWAGCGQAQQSGLDGSTQPSPDAGVDAGVDGGLPVPAVPGWVQNADVEDCDAVRASGTSFDVYAHFDRTAAIDPDRTLRSSLGGGLFRVRYDQRGQIEELSNLAETSGFRPVQVVEMEQLADGGHALLISIRSDFAGDVFEGPAEVRFQGTPALDLHSDLERNLRYLINLDAAHSVRASLDLSDAYPRAMAVLDDGSVMLVGSHVETTTIGAIALPAVTEAQDWLARVGADGQVLWANDVGAHQRNVEHLVVRASGASVVTNAGGAIQRVEPDGRVTASWTVEAGQQVGDLKLLASGELVAFYVNGQFSSVARFPLLGGPQASKSAISNGLIDVIAFRVQPGGSFAVTGSYIGQVSFGAQSSVQAPRVEGRNVFLARFSGSDELVSLNVPQNLFTGLGYSYASKLDVSPDDGSALICGFRRNAFRFGESDWTRDLQGMGLFIARYRGIDPR